MHQKPVWTTPWNWCLNDRKSAPMLYIPLLRWDCAGSEVIRYSNGEPGIIIASNENLKVETKGIHGFLVTGRRGSEIPPIVKRNLIFLPRNQLCSIEKRSQELSSLDEGSQNIRDQVTRVKCFLKNKCEYTELWGLYVLQPDSETRPERIVEN